MKPIVAFLLVAGIAAGGIWGANQMGWIEFGSSPSGEAAASDAQPETETEPTNSHAESALAQMEAELQRSAAAAEESEGVGRTGGNPKRPITRPNPLEKEDNVNVGVVFSVDEDGVKAEGKGIKAIGRLLRGKDKRKD